MRVIDISQPVQSGTAVWPGDRPFSCGWSMRMADGDSVNVATLDMSVHTGTHIDGPLHFENDGAPAGAIPLDNCLGPARVVDVRGADVIDVDAVQYMDLATVERLLFRTRDEIDPMVFPASFPAISPELARMISAAGVRLVGTESPSVDPMDSKELETHRILAAGGVVILENVVLTDVEQGDYTLVALPLKLMEADSSPVRAALIDVGD